MAAASRLQIVQATLLLLVSPNPLCPPQDLAPFSRSPDSVSPPPEPPGTARATAAMATAIPGTASLDKPSFTPPDAVFPVVWTTLYAAIAWSGWRIWTAAPSRERNAALRLWVSQLAANAQWSKLFFGERRPTLALADVLALEGTIFSYIAAARKVDRGAANAFIPYAAWVAFATVLNAEILRRNPHER